MVPITSWTLQRYCNGWQLAALLRWLAARDATAMAGNGLELEVFLFFFLFDNFKREKEWEKERSFDTCSLVSWFRWLLETQAPSNNTSSNVSSALLPAKTTRVTTIQEFQKQETSIAFNMKQ
jgi:hypothetical protein